MKPRLTMLTLTLTLLTQLLLWSPFSNATTITLSIPSIVADSGQQAIQVPIKISDVTFLGIMSAQMTIHYDPSVIVATGVDFTNTIAQGVFPAHTVGNGSINLAFTRANFFVGSGTLAIIHFDVVSSNPNAQTQLTITNARLNEGKGFDLVTINGELMFKDSFILGDVSGDGKVTAYDAALVLRHVVGRIELSVTQQKAADVTLNDRITAFDAARILQYVVGKLKL